MTREEKFNLLNELLEYEENNDIGNLTRAERREFQQWINEALEQQSCEDAISRKDTLEALEQEEPLVWCDGADEIAARNQWKSDVDTIKNMPTVQPKPIECEDAISRDDALMCMTGKYIADMTYKPEDIISKHIRRLRALPSVQPKYNASEWCHDCKEYDHEKHCCPRCNKVIRKAVEEIKQPRGHWISYWDEEARCYVYKCPECGNKQPFDTKHCWECGASMVEPQESEG